ncbi:MAG: ribonuclease R [Merdibacter sp.]|nr:ribonuclease R [Merdibacter sp.]
MKEKILQLISEAKQGLSVQDISEKLNVQGSAQYTKLIRLLNHMEDNLAIARDERDRYHLAEELGYFQGVLRVNPKGFGFIDLDDISYYVAKENLHLGMDQDVVAARILKDTARSTECEVVRILEHHNKRFVGVVKKDRDRFYFLSDKDLAGRRISVSNYDEFPLVHDSKVLVEIDSYGRELRGHITKVLGYKYDPGIDILSLLLENDIYTEFSEDTLEEIKSVPSSLDESMITADRHDLRSLLTITIDGEDARDFDDAISIEKIKDGYRLWVHIADVSYYVRPHTALDEEAYRRGTSVYVTDRVVPMLPQVLSNGICSLNPQEDRFAITAQMDIGKDGAFHSYQIYPSVIKSDERMTYTKVNQIMNGDAKLMQEYRHLLVMISWMHECAHWIRKRRHDLGAINFDKKESKIIVNEKGEPQDVVLRERGEAERIIEDFMIAANECVASHLKWMDLPGVYRVHEQPEPKKVRAFARIAKTLGYSFVVNTANVHATQYQKLLEEAKGEDNYDVLSTYMLRSMQKARYDAQCLGHFGLGLQEYLHFTSPIRRYPDLVVHRMLRRYVFANNHDEEQIKKDTKWCAQAAADSSVRERCAQEAERDVDDMKKAQYMERYVGDIYTGTVSGITRFGMFVELENTIEGLVHVSSMKDDHYVYHEEALALIGEHTANMYRMGDKVNVRCVAANRWKRQIDFELIDNKPKRSKKRPNRTRTEKQRRPIRKHDRHRGNRRGKRRNG